MLATSAIPAAVVVALVGRLRAGGLPVSTSESLDGLRALAAVDITHRPAVRAALRATLVKDPTRGVLFDRAFEAVFPRARRERPGVERSAEQLTTSLVEALHAGDEAAVDDALEEAIERYGGQVDDGRSAGHHVQRTLRRMNVADLYQRYLATEDSEDDLDRALATTEASRAMEQMRRRLEDIAAGRVRDMDAPALQSMEDPEDRDLLRAGPDDLALMRQAMRPLVRRLATRLSQRRRHGSVTLDMRRTIRSSMGYGGVPVSPALRQRRPTKPDLVVLCDVSGSTAAFAPFTLTLLHAVHQEFRRVRSFVFIDGIVEITDILASSPGVLDPHHLLARQGLIAQDGRSDYRRALDRFLRTWGDSITPKTSVIVAGDARSHTRPPAIRELAEIKHRSRRLYWLNPEPESEWDSLDSRMAEYSRHCSQVFSVSTLRTLIAAVEQIV